LFSRRRRHTRFSRDWSSDVCSSDLAANGKESITIGDVLSHSAGVPFMTPPYKAVDVVVDEKLAVQALADLVPSWRPGRFRVYHEIGRASCRERVYDGVAHAAGKERV